MANNQIVWCISELTNIKEFPDKYPITKESILSFVDILVSNAKARTGIGEKRIKEYNQLFYEHLAFYFRTEKYLDVNSEKFKTLCSMFKVPVIKNNIRSDSIMTIGDVRERREDDLLNYPNNAEELLSKSYNKVHDIKNNIGGKEEMLPGDDTRQKIRHKGNIMDNPKGCGMPMEHGGIGFFPENMIHTHTECLELFNKLSNEEMIKFIKEIKDLEIKLTLSDILDLK